MRKQRLPSRTSGTPSTGTRTIRAAASRRRSVVAVAAHEELGIVIDSFALAVQVGTLGFD